MIKKLSDAAIKSKDILNQQLAEELQLLENVSNVTYTLFLKGNIRGADVIIQFLLCVIDIYSKYS